MRQFDEKVLAGLHTADELLDSKYGVCGTGSRKERVEGEDTDMQLSSFLRIADALHINFNLQFA